MRLARGRKRDQLCLRHLDPLEQIRQFSGQRAQCGDGIARWKVLGDRSGFGQTGLFQHLEQLELSPGEFRSRQSIGQANIGYPTLPQDRQTCGNQGLFLPSQAAPDHRIDAGISLKP